MDNYHSISCLPVMWKVLTGIISVYSFSEEEKIFLGEQNGCKRNSRGTGCKRNSRRTKDELLSDKAVLRDSKRRITHIAKAWINYRMVYNMIPHSWISKCLKLFIFAEKTKKFLVNSMSKWKLELTYNGVS